MLTATGSLAQLRPHYCDDARDLLRVLLNATSATEANLALDVLRDSIPEKVLVTACNLREVLRSLPTSPFAMRVDEGTLAKVVGLKRDIATMSKELGDGRELVVTTAGNLVLDVIVRHEGEKSFWNPVPVTEDFVTTEALDHAIESHYVLDALIEFTRGAGVVFNPKFYLSLEDWALDHASDVFEGLEDLF